MSRDEKRGYQDTVNNSIGARKSSSDDKYKTFYGCIFVDNSTTNMNQLRVTVSAMIKQTNDKLGNFLQILGFY